jgi:tetratricopeptide (TPR) repeat protein
MESLAAAAANKSDEKLSYLKSALKEMLIVFANMPKESSVALKIGTLHKRLGSKEDALRYYTMAQDLDPKDNSIKNAIDRLDKPEAQDDSTFN